jgi:hypothetical protein
MIATSFTYPAVKAAFDAHPPPLRRALLRLRRLVLQVAARHSDIGALVETLNWGEPAYLPAKPRVGTTIRLNAVKGSPDLYAACFHCRTTLVASFRRLYRDELRFEGNRAIVFSLRDEVPEDAFRHCVAMALTYHARST